jgi:hypothetical protein
MASESQELIKYLCASQSDSQCVEANETSKAGKVELKQGRPVQVQGRWLQAQLITESFSLGELFLV